MAARAEWKHCFRRNPAFASSWLIRTRTLWRQRRSNFLRKDQITPFPLHELNICGGLMSERARLMRPCSTSELYSFCNMYKKKSNPLQALAYLAIRCLQRRLFPLRICKRATSGKLRTRSDGPQRGYKTQLMGGAGLFSFHLRRAERENDERRAGHLWEVCINSTPAWRTTGPGSSCCWGSSAAAL